VLLAPQDAHVHVMYSWSAWITAAMA